MRMFGTALWIGLALQKGDAKMWIKSFKFTKMLLGDMPVRENGEGWEDCHSIMQV